jgi:hypothetical protein
MENGGDNEHRPWYFDSNGTTDTTDTYRKFVNAHLELGALDLLAALAQVLHSSFVPVCVLHFAGPYFYANGVAAFEGNYSAIIPRVRCVCLYVCVRCVKPKTY